MSHTHLDNECPSCGKISRCRCMKPKGQKMTSNLCRDCKIKEPELDKPAGHTKPAKMRYKLEYCVHQSKYVIYDTQADARLSTEEAVVRLLNELENKK